VPVPLAVVQATVADGVPGAVFTDYAVLTV